MNRQGSIEKLKFRQDKPEDRRDTEVIKAFFKGGSL